MTQAHSEALQMDLDTRQKAAQAGFDYFMGIDPGKSGGLVVMDRTTVLASKSFHNMTVGDIWGFISEWSARPARHMERVKELGYGLLVDGAKVFALLEKVHAWPGAMIHHRCDRCGNVMVRRQPQGAKSVFTFGSNFGHLQMALAAASIPHMEIAPSAWQRQLNVPSKAKGETKTAHKNKLKAMAQKLHPEMKMTLALADATLLAELCKLLKG